MDSQQLASGLSSIGGRLFLVGGAVRDMLLERVPKDKDFCVTGVTENQLLSIIPKAKRVGKSFPVLLCEIDGERCEVALARTERKVGAGHRGFSVDFSPDITIEQDLSRRDITINAMAIDVLSGQLIDPFNGSLSIASRELRATGQSFIEDPLRVYRVARFAAQLNFQVDDSTEILMSYLKSELSTLTKERVFEELRKAINSINPAMFFRTLYSAGVLDVHFPEVARLFGVEQPIDHHPEGHAFEHTMQVLSAMAYLTPREELRWAALCHDLGKGLTPREYWPKHHGHEEIGVEPTKELNAHLGVPTTWKRTSVFGTRNHGRVHGLYKMRPIKIVDLLASADKNPIGVDGLSLLAQADSMGRGTDRFNTIHPYASSMVSLWNQTIKNVNGSTVNLPDRPELRAEVLRSKRANYFKSLLETIL